MNRRGGSQHRQNNTPKSQEGIRVGRAYVSDALLAGERRAVPAAAEVGAEAAGVDTASSAKVSRLLSLSIPRLAIASTPRLTLFSLEAGTSGIVFCE